MYPEHVCEELDEPNIFLVGEIETWVGDSFILHTALEIPGSKNCFIDTMIPVRSKPITISKIRKTRVGVNGSLRNEIQDFGNRLIVEAHDVYLVGPGADDLNMVILKGACTVHIDKEQKVPFDDPRFIEEMIHWEHVIIAGNKAYPCLVKELIVRPADSICCLISEPYPHLALAAIGSMDIDVGPLGSRPTLMDEKRFQEIGKQSVQQQNIKSNTRRKPILGASRSASNPNPEKKREGFGIHTFLKRNT